MTKPVLDCPGLLSPHHCWFAHCHFFIPLPTLSPHNERMHLSRTLAPNPYQFSSVAQSCLTLCDPVNCSTPGLPVHHKFPEFTQTHAHRVGDAIQPSHPLSYRLIIFLLDRVEKAWAGVTVFSPTLPSLAGWPLGNHSTSSLVTKSVWDPAAHLSKANKQAKLMEGKVCFILDASN